MKLPGFLVILTIMILGVIFGKLGGEGSDAESTPPKRQKFTPVDPRPEAVRSDRPMNNSMDNLNWLADNSSFIFVGRVSATKAEKDARGLIITKNQFFVENIIAGDSKMNKVTLITLGGTVGDESMTVSNLPKFTVNQTYVVFTDLKRPFYNSVTGNQNGVFPIVSDAVYTFDGRAVVGIKDGKIQTGELTLQSLNKEKNRQNSTQVSATPKISGSIVSLEQTSTKAESPMQLNAFIEAVLASKRR